MAVPLFLGSFFIIDMCVGSIVPPAPGIPRGDQGEGRWRRHDEGGSGSGTRDRVGREEMAAVAAVVAMAGRGGAGRGGISVEAGGGIEEVPLIGGGGEVRFVEGMKREFSMEKKREGDREAAEEVFLASDPLYQYFFSC
jgi:hypothetical protein